MIRHRVGRVVAMVAFGIVVAPLFLGVFGYVVMRLWNWLLPGLFGVHVITFWQAVGILILSKILFGGFRGRRGGRGRSHWRQRMNERWGKMTPEEREKFRQGFRGRCAPFGSEPGESKA